MKKPTQPNLKDQRRRSFRSSPSVDLGILFFLVLFLLIGCGILVLLVLRDQVVHVALRLRELHLVHPLPRVPVQEGLPPEHGRELLADPVEHLLDRGDEVDGQFPEIRVELAREPEGSTTVSETLGDGKTEKVSIIRSGYSSLIFDISNVPMPDPVPPPIAVLRLLAHNIENGIDKLGTFGVVTLGPVVSGSGLPEHEVVRAEDLAVCPRPDTVHGSRLQIHEHCSGNEPTATGFIIVYVHSLELKIAVTVVPPCGVDAVLGADNLPELRPDLVPALPALDVEYLTHLRNDYSSESRRLQGEDQERDWPPVRTRIWEWRRGESTEPKVDGDGGGFKLF
ncbi:unnamed protein product [Spirodela intermedia]|uniref:Uncharacterized protein n=2 Tax=Spirodela intermedia TaxID=51605 RepID=A0A7I8K0B4_SPIIN|nr:unnamed protein product [Spirodela intermedia]CAA6655077.1 unnamed protein product [Spirodela intermedia]CAA7389827.1 unnamed protein product [Spirodela intermedia]